MTSTDARTVEELMAVPEQLAHRMGITVETADAQTVRGSMPVAGNTQPFGLLHGGASAVLVETLGSIGAVLHAGPGRLAVGVDLNVTHHRAVSAGSVHGTATALHLGRSIACYEVGVVDDAGRRVCTGRLTCSVRDRVPGQG